MTAAVEDGTVRRDVIADVQLLRNVIGALRRALDEHPDGCLEAALWHGVEACFVPRVIFDEAVDIMVYASLALRAGGRLHAGLNRKDAARAGCRKSATSDYRSGWLRDGVSLSAGLARQPRRVFVSRVI